MVSGSLGSQKERGCLSHQSSQALEQGSWLQLASRGVASQLGVAINREPHSTTGGSISKQGPRKEQNHCQILLLPLGGVVQMRAVWSTTPGAGTQKTAGLW